MSKWFMFLIHTKLVLNVTILTNDICHKTKYPDRFFLTFSYTIRFHLGNGIQMRVEWGEQTNREIGKRGRRNVPLTPRFLLKFETKRNQIEISLHPHCRVVHFSVVSSTFHQIVQCVLASPVFPLRRAGTRVCWSFL